MPEFLEKLSDILLGAGGISTIPLVLLTIKCANKIVSLLLKIAIVVLIIGVILKFVI